jgi:hypothetical protein
MEGQLGFIIDVNFHWLKGTNVTVNHIRSLREANAIQKEMIDGFASLQSRFRSIWIVSLQILFKVITSKSTVAQQNSILQLKSPQIKENPPPHPTNSHSPNHPTSPLFLMENWILNIYRRLAETSGNIKKKRLLNSSRTGHRTLHLAWIFCKLGGFLCWVLQKTS